MNKYVAECVGTFLLTLAVNISLAHEFPVPTAIVAALTLGVCVYVFGDVSGTHINPAITIGILSVGKISALEAINYLLAQCVGAGLAVFMSLAVITPAPIVAASTAQVFIGEILGAFCLAMGVASVVFGKTPAPAAGLTVGGSLLLGISIASSVSNGVLNPAVAMGIGSVSVAYLAAPIIGTVIAFRLYRFLTAEKETPRVSVESTLQVRSVVSSVN